MADDPLTIRYNNPGAIEYKPWLKKYGATLGENGRYAQFPDVEAGYRAMEGLLGTYRNTHGLNTVNGIVNRWAPPNVDNNSTSQYAASVAKRLGVDPNHPLDASVTPKLAEAMAAYEAGRPVPRAGGPVQATPLPPLQPQSSLMAQPQQQQQVRPMQEPRREATFAEHVNGRLANPMVQGGIGLLLSAMQGGNLNEGLSAGTQRAKALQDQWMTEQAAREKEIQKQAFDRLMQNQGIFGGLPPAMLEVAKITRDPSPLMSILLEQQKQKSPMNQAELALKQAQAKKAEAEAVDGGFKVNEVNGQLIRTDRDGKTSVLYGSDPVTQRREQVRGAGLDPNSAPAKVFIATGKMPKEEQILTATDKKAILEADESVNNTEGVINNLREALDLSKKAYTGPTAGGRGYLGSLVGMENAVATEKLNNIVTTNSLQSLKSIFGGNPTEGERKILLEIQGSANKSQEVREDIYRRALILAERRQQFNKQRAEQMRGGTYFRGNGSAPATNAAPANGGWAIERLE